MNPDVSFIVSCYDRPLQLAVCLWSLAGQTHRNIEVIVTDNAVSQKIIKNHKLIVHQVKPHLPGLRYEKTQGKLATEDCYHSAEWGAKRARGEFLCFPSDDSLYVADFTRIMLETARREKADLVYCDCVYKQGSIAGVWPPYSVLDVSPRMGRIDKTCFIVRRDSFKGFPPHPQDYRDGALIEQLVAAGVPHAKAPGVLVVHQ